MIHPALPVTLIALAIPAAAAIPDDLDGVQMAQVTIHERVIIRIPRLSTPRGSALPVGRTPIPTAWKEKKGPKCVAVAEIGGVIVGSDDSIDMVLSGNRRIRAKLEGGCSPMDFYSGFYLRPAADGKVCADRDSIRMRSGGSCEIDAFRTLYAGN